MIFSQTQQQAILILIGIILLGVSISSFMNKQEKLKLKEVNPILLEVPKQQQTFVSPISNQQNSSKKRHKRYPTYRKKTSNKSKSLGKESIAKSVDLNTADSTALDAIPGIGPTLARRILKYKSLIGHFIEVEQLQMVYGLSMENYKRMAPHFIISPIVSEPQHDLNSVKSYKIAWFIGKEKAKQLSELRQQQGWFSEWSKLGEANFLTERELRWLKSYFFIKKRDTLEHVSSPK